MDASGYGPQAKRKGWIAGMDPAVGQAIEQMELLYNQATSQLRLLAEHRRNIEEQRRRILLQLEEPGDSNPELHQTLARIDHELEVRRREEREIRQRFQSEINLLGREAHQLRQTQRREIEEQLQQAQTEADHIRDVLLPEARRYLEDLESRQRKMDSVHITLANHLADLNREMPDFNRFDLSE